MIETLDRMNQRLDRMNERLDRMDERLDRMTGVLHEVKQMLDTILMMPKRRDLECADSEASLNLTDKAADLGSSPRYMMLAAPGDSDSRSAGAVATSTGTPGATVLWNSSGTKYG